MSTHYVALKEFQVGKKHYSPGDPIDTKDWPFRRDVLLEGQRFIKRTAPPDRVFLTTRPLTIGVTAYAKGEKINHSSLPIDKLEQMIERRLLVISDGGAPRPDVKGA